MKKRILLVLILLLTLGVVVLFWASNNAAHLLSFTSLGRLTGLLATYFVLLQLLFISRSGFIESVFGLDRLFLMHHLNGFIAFIFILLHPIFIALGYAARSGRTFGGQLWSFLSWEGMLAAFVAFFFFILIVVLSVLFAKGKVNYEKWYVIHFLNYLAIILAYSHEFEFGFDLRHSFFGAYFVILYTVVIALLVVNRFLRPIWFLYRHRFRVSKIVSENPQVTSIYLEGKNLSGYHFQAGQFALVRFLNKHFLDGHPFSFSQEENGREIRFTIKALGDFTSSLKERIKVGDYALLDGPYGRFTLKVSRGRKIALLVGGVGITPARSILGAGLNQGRDMVAVASFKTEAEVLFKQELESLGAPIKYVVSDRDGRLDEEKLKNLVPDYLERDFYLCGPPPMTNSLLEILEKLGVKAKNVHFEKFSW